MVTDTIPVVVAVLVEGVLTIMDTTTDTPTTVEVPDTAPVEAMDTTMVVVLITETIPVTSKALLPTTIILLLSHPVIVMHLLIATTVITVAFPHKNTVTKSVHPVVPPMVTDEVEKEERVDPTIMAALASAETEVSVEKVAREVEVVTIMGLMQSVKQSANRSTFTIFNPNPGPTTTGRLSVCP